MIRLLIADDHAIFRQGLRRVIDFAADLDVAAEARNGREVIEQVRVRRFDAVLLDLDMPGVSGIELIKLLVEQAPALPILVLTVHDEVELARRAVAAGAAGYVTKDGEPEALLDAVRTVARGGHYVAPQIATRMLYQGLAPDEAPHRSLSDREFQVFRRLADGESIGEIAEALQVSPKTISTHKFRAMQKLGLRTDGELVRYAIRHGLAA